MVSHRKIDGSGGVELHTVVSGSGQLILFLHGFPEFWQAWAPQLRHFGRKFMAAAVDLRGYNLSDKPDDISSYALTHIVEDIRCVVQALSPDKPAIIVGHDWGGIAAWSFAREHPELVDRLIVINGPHPAVFARELAQSAAQRFASSYSLLFRSPEVADEILSAFDYALLRKMVFGRTTKPDAFPEELRSSYLQSWKQPRALRSALKYYSAAHGFSGTRNENWKISVPTLVLWGEADAALLTGNLRGLEDYVAELWVHRHPTATHWIIHEEPAWVNSHIESFIREGDGRWSTRGLEQSLAGKA